MNSILLTSPEAPSRTMHEWCATAPRRPKPLVHQFVASMTPTAWMCLDWLVIGLAAFASWALLVFVGTGFRWVHSPWLVSVTLCATIAVSGLVFGLYERKTLLARSRILVRSMLTLTLGVVLAFACLNLFFYTLSSRWVGLLVALTYIGVALPVRLYAHEVISSSRARLLCVGAGASIQRLVDILAHRQHQQYEVVGHVRVPSGALRLVASAVEGAAKPRFRNEADLRFADACPCLGNLDQLADVLGEHDVDEIVVASDLASDATVGRAVAPCLEGSCRVTDQATFVEKLLGEVPADSITAEWFLRADVQNRSNYEAVGRLMDLAVAGLGLLLTLPLWPVIALLIRLDGAGPVFFRQVRVGQRGRLFQICKFRTMCVDAEKDGARWATENDSRVTRIGRFLRGSRLDELPQLLNILRGDMSLVGPRPERPEFVHRLEHLLPHYRLRHLIKPGLTGWAQIQYGYGGSVAEAHRKLCYDLYYLKHRSLELNVAILIRTLGTFVLGAR
jgi:exopolysaccharide biosynthesis polyprenyl glycosylphosphotransferase